MDHSDLQILFLGSGSAFCVGTDNYHSNLLLTHNNKTLLIDCGSDIRHSLHEQGFDYNSIDDVYISHLHADHVGGLEWLGFNRKFNSTREKPVLHINHVLAEKLWVNVLSGCMSSVAGTRASLKLFFKVKSIGRSGYFKWQGIKFNLVRTTHVKNNWRYVHSYGLYFVANGTHIFITTDTTFNPKAYKKYFKLADVIFHDCETQENKSGVHADYNELVGLDESIKSKMWLYHYNPGSLPDAINDGFKGFVMKGQRFIFKG